MLSVNEPPRQSAEVFAIPIEHGKFILYVPARQIALIGNRAAVNLLVNLETGTLDRTTDPVGLLMDFLGRLEIVGIRRPSGMLPSEVQNRPYVVSPKR
jgi:hypothetical protein